MPDPSSPRLLYRLPEPDDFDFVYALQSDPETMTFIRAPETDPQVIRERMAFWQTYRQNQPGLGVWMLSFRDTDEPVGYCVLRHIDFIPGNDLELGYVIAPAYWGQGLATEVTQALLNYAQKDMGAQKVVAFTDPGHLLSQKVLLKCGFKPAGTATVYSEEDAFFVWDQD
jgi:ribosomal-protein-alanine N-acetyltransferase